MSVVRRAPIDEWSLKEKLTLAGAVLQLGDENWNAVSKAIKPLMDEGRIIEWCSPKNCAQQYSELLDQVEIPKRKRGEKLSEAEAPSRVIVRRLAAERIDFLNKSLYKIKDQYRLLKDDIEEINAGMHDSNLENIYGRMQNEMQAEQKKEEEPIVQDETDTTSNTISAEKPEEPAVQQVEEKGQADDEAKTAADSDAETDPGDQIKTEQDLNELEHTSREETVEVEEAQEQVVETVIEETTVPEEPAEEVVAEPQPIQTKSEPLEPIEVVAEKGEEVCEVSGVDAPSPGSSISTRSTTETVKPAKPKGGRKKGGRRSRNYNESTTEIEAEGKEAKFDEDVKIEPVESDVKLESEQDVKKADKRKLTAAEMNPESTPASPASFTTSETDDERSHKAWKRSIMMVWGSIANHRYANVFKQPVTDDQAPGYTRIVKRPMDLSTIKRNVEMGALRTTVEFQRDMMLMFTNAMMYNSQDHDVHQMAKEMYNDVLERIQQFVETQTMMGSGEFKSLRHHRRTTETTDHDKEEGRGRYPSEPDSEPSKSKRRKV